MYQAILCTVSYLKILWTDNHICKIGLDCLTIGYHKIYTDQSHIFDCMKFLGLTKCSVAQMVGRTIIISDVRLLFIFNF